MATVASLPALYMWVLYGFLILQWFLISDFVDLKHRGIGRQRFARQPTRRDVGMIAIRWAVSTSKSSITSPRAFLTPCIRSWPAA